MTENGQQAFLSFDGLFVIKQIKFGSKHVLHIGMDVIFQNVYPLHDSPLITTCIIDVLLALTVETGAFV